VTIVENPDLKRFVVANRIKNVMTLDTAHRYNRGVCRSTPKFDYNFLFENSGVIFWS